MLPKITILCISLLLRPCLAAEGDRQERQLSTPPVTTPTPTPTSITATFSSTTCVVAPTVTMSYFNWFNSSHNVDCANWNFPGDSEVCWMTNITTGVSSLCETEDPCICTGYCSVGLPAIAYQPYGWGPPDTLGINFNSPVGEAPSCIAENPTPAGRVWELGAGTFDCGTGPNVMGFYGDSNADSGNNGSVYYNDYRDGACALYNYPQYTATFPLSCSRDDQNNATCVTSLPVILTFAGWYS